VTIGKDGKSYPVKQVKKEVKPVEAINNPVDITDENENDIYQELAIWARVPVETLKKIEYLQARADEETLEKLRQDITLADREYERLRELADPKPDTPKAEDVSAIAEPEISQASSPKKLTCAEELGPSVAITTLKNIRQDAPEYLLRALASHFRKGFIEDLMLEGIAFLHEKHGEAVTTPIIKELVKRYFKTSTGVSN
jgi:hypothetical protein